MDKKVVIEYERKFLVKEIPKDVILDIRHSNEIEQIYIGSQKDELCVRIRKEAKYNDAPNYFIMMKMGELKSHLEWTREISFNEYCDLLKFQKESITINKTRYFLQSSTNPNITIELDVFHGNLDGLMIAEVEDITGNPSIIDDYKPEPWFSTEVTNDHHFYNVNLAYKYKKPHRNFLLNLFGK